MRVGFALILLVDLASRALRLVADYSDSGIIPRDIALQYFVSKWVFPLGYLSGSVYLEAAIFLSAAIAATAMLIGYRTRLATILSWVFLLSIHMRNPYILQNGDVLLRLSLFWAMFLPWGSLYSIDSLKRTDRGTTSTVLSLGSAFFLLQAGLMYLVAFLTKLPGKEWVTGNAIYYALNIDYYVRPLGKLLLQYENILRPMTFSVLAFEGILILILFSPIFTKQLRLFAVASTILLHVGMGLSLHLGPFPWVSVVSIMAFIPSFFWDFLTKSLRQRERHGLTIYYDGDCGFCRKAARAVPKIFFIQTVTVMAAPREDGLFDDMMTRNSWISKNANGERHYKVDVLIQILRHSPIMFPIAAVLSVPPIHYLGNKVYEFIAARRSRTCTPDSKITFEPFSTDPLPAWANAAAIYFMLLVVCTNLSMLTKDISVQKTLEYNPVNTFFALRQRWTMFAPDPVKRDGWYVMAGTLADGSEVDVYRDGQDVSFNKPQNIAEEFSGERERGLLARLATDTFTYLRSHYAHYLCSEWNTSHSQQSRLRHLKIIFMLETTPPPGTTPTTQPLTLFEGDCL
jgi:predicted DCC family thiol-disulfide oxidoreductase YuxK